MSSSSFEQKLQNDIDQLSREKLPKRDLWTGIEQAIEHTEYKANNHHTPVFAIAASVCVLSVVGWLSFNSGQTAQSTELVAQLSAQHAKDKNTLLVQYKDQPSATPNWQAQLMELEEAASAIKKALEQEPNNPALIKMLSQVYEKQMNLIERVHTPTWQRI